MAFYSRLVLLVASLTLTHPAPCYGFPDPLQAKLKGDVLSAKDDTSKAKAYRSLITYVGRRGLEKLKNDDDVGIALQASWELGKQPAKRKSHIPLRTDDIYSPDELGLFVAILKKRINTPVPEWWEKSIQDIDLFPGQHHVFRGHLDADLQRTKVSGFYIVKNAQLTKESNTYTYAIRDKKSQFTLSDDELEGCDYLPACLNGKQAFFAPCSIQCASPYKLVACNAKAGEHDWISKVWASRRGFSSGPPHHRVEVTLTDKSVFVFGSESHGMYLEAFEISTGKCLYRFCTSYWDNHSETWRIKP